MQTGRLLAAKTQPAAGEKHVESCGALALSNFFALSAAAAAAAANLSRIEMASHRRASYLIASISCLMIGRRRCAGESGEIDDGARQKRGRFKLLPFQPSGGLR